MLMMMRRWPLRPTIPTPHVPRLRLIHWAFATLRGCPALVAIAMGVKRLQPGSTMLVHLRARTACAVKSSALTRIPKLLRCWPTTKALAKPTPHPACSTAIHLPTTGATLRSAESSTTTWCTEGPTLRKTLRTTALETRLKATTRARRLTKLLRTPCMILTTVAVMGWMDRSAIPLRLCVAAWMITAALAIHRRTTEAITTRAISRIAIALIARIHRPPLAISLRLVPLWAVPLWAVTL